MPLLAFYVVLFVTAWLASTRRREITLIRGRTVLWVHAAFLAAQVMWLTAGILERGGAAPEGQPDGPGFAAALLALATFAALTAASFPLRHRWLLSSFDESRFRETLEISLRRLRIPFESEPSGYALALPAGPSRVTYRACGGRRALVRFERGASEQAGAGRKKLDLLRSLLVKRFGRLVARPRIRFD